ncbi:MAG: hypothetical protein Tsb002_14290 [Wenzhouxiangellaceae bacterium]
MIRRLYRLLLPYRWRELIWQLRQQQPTETDIHLFQRLDPQTGLVIDIGANRGQFALSLMRVNRHLRILSLEANPELRWILRFIRLLHPWRFRFLLCGAGDQHQQLQLHIPYSANSDLSPNASLVPAEFDKEYVRERLSQQATAEAGQYHFRHVNARVMPVDALNLQPLAVKLDVEGFEMPALKGMEETLNRCHPLLMIEMNNQHQFIPWLQQRGYRIYRYEHQQQRLIPLAADEWSLNVFALHEQTPASIRQAVL